MAAITLPNVTDGNWNQVRRNFNRIKSVLLGIDSTPSFTSLVLSGLTDNSLVYSTGGTLTSLGAATNGQIPIGSTGAVPVLAAITGTTNQVVSTPGAGTITLSTPQDIHTGASPTFADLTLSAPSSIYTLSHDSFANFVADEHVAHTGVTLTAGSGLSGGGDISVSRSFALDTGASPTFVDLTLSSPFNIYALSHDSFADFSADEHFLQTAITNISTGLATGMLKVTTGTGALSVVTGINGTLILDDGGTEKITLVFTDGVLTSRTVEATTSSLLIDWTD